MLKNEGGAFDAFLGCGLEGVVGLGNAEGAGFAFVEEGELFLGGGLAEQ